MTPAGEDLSQNYQAQRTIDIEGSGTIVGRAYLESSKFFLATNFHVINAFCESLPGKTCVSNKLVLRQGSHPNNRIPIRVTHSLCLQWLDICLLRLEDLTLLGSDPDEKFEPPKFPQLLSLARDNVEQAVFNISGKELENGKILNILDIASRKGLSGTPVFDRDGFLGLATANFHDFNMVNYIIYKKIWGNQIGLYSPTTILVSAEAIERFAKCLDANLADCRNIKQDLLIDLVRDLLQKIKSKNLSTSQKLLFISKFRLEKSALSQVEELEDLVEHNSICDLSERDRDLHISIQFLEYLSRMENSKAKLDQGLKRIKECNTPAEKILMNEIESIEYFWITALLFQ